MPIENYIERIVSYFLKLRRLYERKLVRVLLGIVKVGILVFCIVYIARKMGDYTITEWREAGREFLGEGLWYLAFCLFLVPLNRLIEAYKWKLLADTQGTISLRRAFAGVLSGVSLSFIAPPALADSIARIGITKQGDIKSLAVLTIVNNGTQFTATLFWGLVSLGFMSFRPIPWFIGAGLLLSGFIFWASANQSLPQPIKWMLKGIPNQLRWKMLALSHLRSQIMMLQFFLLIVPWATSINIFKAFPPIGSMFLLKTAIPKFNALGDLGIREFSALFFFKNLPILPHQLVITSLTIWVINTAIPALLGLLFIWRLFTEKKKQTMEVRPGEPL